MLEPSFWLFYFFNSVSTCKQYCNYDYNCCYGSRCYNYYRCFTYVINGS